MDANLIFLLFGVIALGFCIYQVFANIWDDETILLILILAIILVAFADIRMLMNLLNFMGW